MFQFHLKPSSKSVGFAAFQGNCRDICVSLLINHKIAARKALLDTQGLLINKWIDNKKECQGDWGGV